MDARQLDESGAGYGTTGLLPVPLGPLLTLAVVAVIGTHLIVAGRAPGVLRRLGSEVGWTYRQLARALAGPVWCSRRLRSAHRDWSILRPTGDPTTSPPDRPVLICDDRLLVVLDVRPVPGAPPAGRPLSGGGLLAALDPLTAMAGIAVDAIQWIYDAGDGSAAAALVVLSMDPVANGHAIAARGGGSIGVGRVVALTTARAERLLARHGSRPRSMDASTAARALAGLDLQATDGQARPGGRRSPPPAREGRREMLVAGRWHRALRIDPVGVRALWRSGSAAPLVAELRRTVEHQEAGARLTATIWTRAGPDGPRFGGDIRLTADHLTGLDAFDRDLDRVASRYSLRCGAAIAEQHPRLTGALSSRAPLNRSP